MPAGARHILFVVGARPNFMKAAPVHRALLEAGVEVTLVHTGQHYDADMSEQRRLGRKYHLIEGD